MTRKKSSTKPSSKTPSSEVAAARPAESANFASDVGTLARIDLAHFEGLLQLYLEKPFSEGDSAKYNYREELASIGITDSVREVADRFFGFILRHGILAQQQIIHHLKTSGLQIDRAEALDRTLLRNRKSIVLRLIEKRLEVIPWFSSVNWRVDYRVDSSEFGGEEMMIIIQLRTFDGAKRESFAFEATQTGLASLIASLQSALESANKAFKEIRTVVADASKLQEFGKIYGQE